MRRFLNLKNELKVQTEKRTKRIPLLQKERCSQVIIQAQKMEY